MIFTNILFDDTYIDVMHMMPPQNLFFCHPDSIGFGCASCLCVIQFSEYSFDSPASTSSFTWLITTHLISTDFDLHGTQTVPVHHPEIMTIAWARIFSVSQNTTPVPM